MTAEIRPAFRPFDDAALDTLLSLLRVTDPAVKAEITEELLALALHCRLTARIGDVVKSADHGFMARWAAEVDAFPPAERDAVARDFERDGFDPALVSAIREGYVVDDWLDDKDLEPPPTPRRGKRAAPMRAGVEATILQLVQIWNRCRGLSTWGDAPGCPGRDGVTDSAIFLLAFYRAIGPVGRTVVRDAFYTVELRPE